MNLKVAILSFLIFAPLLLCSAQGLDKPIAVEDEIASNTKTGATGGIQPQSPPQDAPKQNPPVSNAGIKSIAGILRKADKAIKTRDFDELESLVRDTSLIPILRKGGPIMIPLLIASILALGTILDRLFFLLNEKRKRDPKALEKFLKAVSEGDMKTANGIGLKSKFYVLRALSYGLAHSRKSLTGALLYAQEQEMKRFRRGISVLDTVITLAPLLGLLGTVTGMMGSFSLIGGDLGAPGAITGGIAEALIATAFGLGIAITSLIPFNYLNTKMEDARLEIETAATQLQLLMHPNAKKVEPEHEESTNGEKYVPQLA